ncbi:MAG: hypothetical protein IIW10_01300 [Spirochaetaceae bacterium]|nr:hypothetical protein [Spirochaetaceae bacterium]
MKEFLTSASLSEVYDAGFTRTKNPASAAPNSASLSPVEAFFVFRKFFFILTKTYSVLSLKGGTR